MSEKPTPIIAIIGGAVAGSEAALLASERGAQVVVIDQNARPYGKIEDGLPRWHVNLRDKEFGRINQNLDRPGVTFVPLTQVGRDISWQALTEELGFSAVVLANGAWRDRPLPVPGIDALVGRGFAYQNPFVYWFNHNEDPDYQGPQYPIVDEAVVVGGGLASIDVVKIINYELYKKALAERGVTFDAETFDKKGIPAICEAAGIDWRDLGIKGATLYYRRRPEDMPLVSAEPGDTSRLAKLAQTRVRILERAIEKFCINFIPLVSPIAVLTEDDGQGGVRVSGMTFQRNEIVDDKLVAKEGDILEVKTRAIYSSIGSIPAVVDGLPMKGELYHWRDWDQGQLHHGELVYGLGNVLTGKGNIVESRKNSKKIMDLMTRNLLGLSDGSQAEATTEAVHAVAHDAVDPVVAAALDSDHEANRAAIAAWIKARHEAVGFESYRAWIDAHQPASHE